MPTKCCWVIPGSLTSERKASTFPSSFINHSTLLLNQALKRQAPCLYMHFEVRALDRLRMRRRLGSTRRRGNHNYAWSLAISAWYQWRHRRLSLSLPLTKVTDAQYRKRFRASYNKMNITLDLFFCFAASVNVNVTAVLTFALFWTVFRVCFFFFFSVVLTYWTLLCLRQRNIITKVWIQMFHLQLFITFCSSVRGMLFPMWLWV